MFCKFLICCQIYSKEPARKFHFIIFIQMVKLPVIKMRVWNSLVFFVCLFAFLQSSSSDLVKRQNEEKTDGTIYETTNRNDAQEISPSFSLPDSFECLRGATIIPLDDVCDGNFHCPDLSDECLCSKAPSICSRVVQYNSYTFSSKKSQCEVGQIDCGDGDCINRSSVCDETRGFPCRVTDAERFCSTRGGNRLNYSETVAPTTGTTRLEQESERFNVSLTTNNVRYTCTSRQTSEQIEITDRMFCDFVIDCDNESDELNCDDGRFYCEDGNSPLFVPEEKVLNNDGDCRDWSDECPANMTASGQIHSRSNLIAYPFLRALVWIMALIAIVGNLAVMIREGRKIRKIFRKGVRGLARANHLLIFNLAFADFLLGIYLVALGIAGASLSGVFCQHLLEWCISTACHALGSIAVIATEASVLTLVLLTAFRLCSIYNPFRMHNFPKLWMVLLSICLTWVTSFLLALIPLSPNLQTTFVPSVLIRGNPFFDNVVVTFDETKILAKSALTYDPSFTPQTAMQTAEKLQKATSYGGLQEALGGARSAKYLEIDGPFGFYSSHSVCIPRFLITKENSSWVYSIAITSFNFVAFVFVALSYSAIAYKAFSQPAAKSKGKSNGKHKAGKKSSTMQWKIFSLIATDFCCWVPISILAFLSISGVELNEVAHVVTAVVLLPINSALNPILYSDVFCLAVRRVQSSTSQESNSTSSTDAFKKTFKGSSSPEVTRDSLDAN